MLLVALAAVLLVGTELWRRRHAPQRPALPPPWVRGGAYFTGTATEVYLNGDDLRAGINPPRQKFLNYVPNDRVSRDRAITRLLEELQRDQNSPPATLPSHPGNP
jgi:hypothetical protein